VANKSQVQISTIHGVLSLFLGRYGSKLGLSSDFKLLSSEQEGMLRRKLLRQLVLSRPEYETLLETYSFHQLETSLQKYFENSFLYPDFRFILQSEVAAQLQILLERLEATRKEVSASILEETSAAAWVKYAEGLQQLSLKVQPSEVVTAIKAVQQFFEINSRKPSFSAKSPAVSSETNDLLTGLVKSLKDLLDSPEWTPAYWQEHEMVNATFAGLAKDHAGLLYQAKIDTGNISISDLELFSLKLIHEHPQACESFSEEWDYWMIDEYQDTSPMQVALLKSLVGLRKSFVVGDPQQSIYLFRGARSEVFQEKMREIKSSGGQIQEKLINYRSSVRLLHFINQYFADASDQFAAMLPAPSKIAADVNTPVAQLRIVEDPETPGP
ncbi:MAG: exonuclease RexA, partial [Proteobacteria bacterium]